MRKEFFYPDKKQYDVTQSFKRKRFGKPKFGRFRLVDLHAYIVDDISAYCIIHLKKERLQQGRGGRVDLLFEDFDNPVEPEDDMKPEWQLDGFWPYRQRKIQGLVKRVCRQADLRGRNPHDLRHTYASILLIAHQSPAYVQKQLGHSSVSITVDIYGHLYDGDGREGLEDALLGPNYKQDSVRKPHIFTYKTKRPR
jgi:integrase